MDGRHRPEDISHPAEKRDEGRIEFLLGDEFKWLGSYLKTRHFAPGIDVESVIGWAKVLRASRSIVDFDPMKDEDGETAYGSYIYLFDKNGQKLPLNVGARIKYQLVSRPSCLKPWKPWRVERKGFFFHETIRLMLKRMQDDGDRIRYIVQIGLDDLSVFRNVAIWKVPKGYVLRKWLEKEAELERESMMAESTMADQAD